jgi:hypothetical protein
MLRCSGPVNTAALAPATAVYIALRMCNSTCRDDDDTSDDLLTAHFARCRLLG